MNALINRLSNGVTTMKPKRSEFFAPIEQAFDTFFNDFFTEVSPSKLTASSGFPKMNAYQHDGQLVIDLTVPGMSEDDVEVSISDGTLTVSGRMNESCRSPENSNFHFREIRESAFSRQIKLPDNLSSKEPLAIMKDGLLTLKWELEKTPEIVPEVKKIQIKKEN